MRNRYRTSEIAKTLFDKFRVLAVEPETESVGRTQTHFAPIKIEGFPDAQIVLCENEPVFTIKIYEINYRRAREVCRAPTMEITCIGGSPLLKILFLYIEKSPYKEILEALKFEWERTLDYAQTKALEKIHLVH